MRKNEVLCIPHNVPDRNVTLFPVFDVDAALVTGTAVGALAGASLLIFILIVVVIIAKILIHGMKLSHEALDVEMTWIKKSNEEDEARIVQQMEATLLLEDSEKRILKYLKNVDKEKAVYEVLGDLGIDHEDDTCTDTIESFKVVGVAPAVASAIQSDVNLKAATEYISLLFREVRGQQGEGGFQEFEKLYFGMKDISNFMEKKDEETISFGGIVSGFTDKKKVIQFLSKDDDEDKDSSLPSGVLFKVQNAKGYNIGKLSDGKTDEVLFEVNSAFKVEAVKEVIQEKYVVVKLSYASPQTEEQMIKL